MATDANDDRDRWTLCAIDAEARCKDLECNARGPSWPGGGKRVAPALGISPV
jgi:hypothetical protein